MELDLLSLAQLAVSALRSATPLLFVLLGECLTQRVGRINLGAEGQMLMGAVAGFAGAAFWGDAWIGLLIGALAGASLSVVYAWLTVSADADPFASGLAVWMLGFGLSAYAGSDLVGVRVDGFAPMAFGTAFDITPTMLLGLGLVPVIAWWLSSSRTGLRWRAVGESPAHAASAGLRPSRIIVAAVMVGGALGGLGGAALSIDTTRSWAEGMTGGRGLVAVGLVIVARWNPWLTLPAALLFGLAEALSLRLQAADSAVPAHLLHMLPYLASLLVFSLTCLRLKSAGKATHAPAALAALFER